MCFRKNWFGRNNGQEIAVMILGKLHISSAHSASLQLTRTAVTQRYAKYGLQIFYYVVKHLCVQVMTRFTALYAMVLVGIVERAKLLAGIDKSLL